MEKVLDIERGGKGQPVDLAPPPTGGGPVATATSGGYGRRYAVNTFQAGVLHTETMTAKEVLDLSFEDVDYHHDRVFERIFIRRPDGEIRKYSGRIPGLGPDSGLPLLEDILWAEGAFLTEEMLSPELRRRWLQPNSRDQQVRRMREAFGDTAELGHFFIVLSRLWRIAWNTRRSWRIVERT